MEPDEQGDHGAQLVLRPTLEVGTLGWNHFGRTAKMSHRILSLLRSAVSRYHAPHMA